VPTAPSILGMTPGFARWRVVHIVASGTVTLLALVRASSLKRWRASERCQAPA
jgi:hypothetical protein